MGLSGAVASMVLKNIFLFTISFLIIAPVSYAKIDVFKVAVRYHKKGNYEKSNRVLLKYYKPFKNRSDKRIYLLLGSNYEVLKEYKKAQNAYVALLKVYFEMDYRNHFIKIKKSSLEDFDDEVSDELAAVYYKLGNLLLKYVKFKQDEEQDFKKDLRLAKIFFHLAATADGDISSLAESGQEKVVKFEEAIQNEISKFRFGLTVGKLFWNDKFTLKDELNGTESTLISNTDANMVALDFRSQSQVYFSRYLVGAFSGTAVVGEKNNYFTKNASSVGAFFNTSFNWVSPFKGASFGLSFPLMYRSINLKDSQTKSVEPKTLFTYGYGIDSTWEWKGLSFGLGMNMMTNFQSAMWKLEIGYMFN